jgi:hypothetical protein
VRDCDAIAKGSPTLPNRGEGMMERNYIKREPRTRFVGFGAKERNLALYLAFDIVNSSTLENLQNVDSTNVMPNPVLPAVLFMSNR